MKVDNLEESEYKGVNPLNLSVYRMKFKKMRKLETPIVVDGKIVPRLPQYEVIEYVDFTTGQIIPADVAYSLGVRQGVDVSMLMLQREYVLESLRPEVKDFAMFLLKFRNNRRGITPDADEICKMYAKLHGVRASNVRRYIPKLKEAGVLESKYMLSPLFQRSGKRLTAKDHLAEDFHAELVFQNELNSKHSL